MKLAVDPAAGRRSLVLDMTYSLSSEAARLLSPPQFYTPGQILDDPRIVPDVPGVYGWWLDGALPCVPMSESIELDGRRLLYVGIARSRAATPERPARRTLRDRLKNHCRGPIATSTFRYTLSALLAYQLRFTPTSEGRKLRIPIDQEMSLTAWMSEHAVVAWVEHTSPWELEELLISSGPRLPLNIMGSRDTFTPTLSRLRRELRRAATAAFPRP